jgi:hypothetical protein
MSIANPVGRKKKSSGIDTRKPSKDPGTAAPHTSRAEVKTRSSPSYPEETLLPVTSSTL